MAEVITNIPSDSLDKSPTSSAPPPPPPSSAADSDLPPPSHPPPHSSYRRREYRRDDRDFDRPPNRRDYYDRNMSPPPRDRDRDFKRRRSPSPPSGGSPRGGYGPDDRSGYDHYGGYDRGGRGGYDRSGRGGNDRGGRGGYADDRSYGRFGNRSAAGYQNGISDMEYNRGYADLPSGGAQREGLMSYKQFIQELEDDILPTEAERRYQEYRTEYISTQKRAYFNTHKDEEWLKDKYHPTNLLTVIERRNESAPQLAKDFLLDLQSGTLDINPGLSASSPSKSGQASEPNSEEEADGPTVIIRGLTSVKGLEGVELLDTLITYLWRIHGVDYYGMIETNDAKGFRHMRPERTGHAETGKSGSEWEKKLDSFWQGRLNGRDPLEVIAAKEKIEAAAVEVLDPYVRKIRDEKYGWKYGCGAKGYTKLFHAAEFVYKHLKLKHPELALEQTSKLREDLYTQNYMNDPDAPGGKPVMQQPQKDNKPLNRRLGMEGRLRDDRGYRRDHERNDKINDGDRPDSPSRARKSKVLEMGNHDETMYDAYAGPGVPPFSSDMPPPVLMPVPGPLGPFVPAPPEVAMQMLRDQGGPSSYDASGINMPSGPHIGGPTPIIAVPPTFRPDPRKMRSYRDLDAPDDEVTVIDYRSL
ncbi:serrate RNA effector molecule [Trifolium repens]|nr:serrate RNA effector molecule [Trifolium repens]